MSSNKKDLRTFARRDGNGVLITGSVVNRRSKPKYGDYFEIHQTYECCGSTTTTSTSTTSTTSTSTSTTTTTTTVPSDARLKMNIRITGKKRGVLNEYTWNWNEIAVSLGLQNFPTTGVMAQEALEVYPKAVIFNDKLGYYTVDYSAIPVE